MCVWERERVRVGGMDGEEREREGRGEGGREGERARVGASICVY